MEIIVMHSMARLFFDHFPAALCVLILVGRIGDIGSTYLITPKLELEGNLIAHKLGWKFAILTLLICLIPFYSLPFGVMALSASLFVSASNISKIWIVRTYGETEYWELLMNLARKSRLSHAVGFNLLAA